MNKIHRRTLTDQVVDELLEMIKNECHPGDQLPTEQALMERLGVSRTPIREATRALSMMNVVQSIAGKGTFVCNIEPEFTADKELFRRLTTAKTLRDLMEVRQIIETEAAFIAAERANDEDLERMRKDVEGLANRITIGGSIPEDLDFHISVLKATRNEVLIQMSKVIIDFYRVHGEPPNEFDVSQHREIYEAILSKDPSRAREAMGKHLSYTANLLLKSFHPGDNDHGRD